MVLFFFSAIWSTYAESLGCRQNVKHETNWKQLVVFIQQDSECLNRNWFILKYSQRNLWSSAPLCGFTIASVFIIRKNWNYERRKKKVKSFSFVIPVLARGKSIFQTWNDQLPKACDRLPWTRRLTRRSLRRKFRCFVLGSAQLRTPTGLPSHSNVIRFLFETTLRIKQIVSKCLQCVRW